MLKASKGKIHFKDVDTWVEALGHHPVFIECYCETRSIPTECHKQISDMSDELYDCYKTASEIDITKVSDLPFHKAVVIPVPKINDISPREHGVILYKDESCTSAYCNSCPHAGIPLDTNCDIWSPDSNSIRCSSHAALFKPDTGACFAGPCAGKFLEKVPIKISKGMVSIKTPTLGNLMASLDRRVT